MFLTYFRLTNLLKFFIPSKKINFYLKSFKKFFVVENSFAKEITKLHEEFIREDINKLKTINNVLKGEHSYNSNLDVNIKAVNEEKIVIKQRII